jgi:hypothetical protein
VLDEMYEVIKQESAFTQEKLAVAMILEKAGLVGKNQ